MKPPAVLPPVAPEAPGCAPPQASLTFGLFDTPRYQAPCAVLGSQDFEFVLYALNVERLPVTSQGSPDLIVEQIESGDALLAKGVLPFTLP